MFVKNLQLLVILFAVFNEAITCKTDDDCPGVLICHLTRKWCAIPPIFRINFCQDQSDCSDHHQCVDHFCHLRPTIYTRNFFAPQIECHSHADCNRVELCINGACVERH